MLKEKIIDIKTGEEIERNYTAAEVAEVEKAKIEAAEKVAKLADLEVKRAALLEKLGITEEEAKLLLG